MHTCSASESTCAASELMPYLYNFFLEIFTSKKIREGKILGVFLSTQANLNVVYVHLKLFILQVSETTQKYM